MVAPWLSWSTVFCTAAGRSARFSFLSFSCEGVCCVAACDATAQNDPSLLDTLSAAYAAAGRYPDAIATANKALELAKTSNKTALVPVIERHRSYYQKSQPLPP